MKLYYSKTSPYARKVRLVLEEKGLSNDTDYMLVNPFETHKDLVEANPLSKVPTLVLDDGSIFYDSPFICRYLDSLEGTKPLIPANEKEKWDVLRREVLADGMIDSAYNIVMERLRPIPEQSNKWIAQWTHEIDRAMQVIDKEIENLGEDITLAHLAFGAAIGYIDFRLSEMLYETTCIQVAKYPHAMTWYEAFKTYRPMINTTPY